MIGSVPKNQALFNTKIKRYPDGSQTVIYCDRPIFRDPYTEPKESDIPLFYEPDNDNYCGYPRPDPNSPNYKARRKKKHKHSESSREEDDEMIYLGNMKRAKDSIFDITMCNDWKYFFTGTFDDSKAGENTTENLLLPVQNWLKNQVRRKGLQYVLVAEYSPLNHRIHFHGLLNEALELVDSGTVLCTGKKAPIKIATADRQNIPQEDRKTVYNIPAWSERFGFTTAIPVTGEPVQLARYITKYITKDCEKIFGKYFWSSRNIIRHPQIVFANTDDFDSIPQEEHLIPGCNFRLKYDCYFEN